MNQFVLYIIFYVVIISIIWNYDWGKRLFSRKKSKTYTLTSTILLTLCGIFYSSDLILIGDITWKKGGAYVLIVALAVFIYGFILENFETEDVKKIIEKANLIEQNSLTLEKEKNKLLKRIESIENDYYRLCSNIIRNSFARSFFEFTDNNGRISIYKHENDQFILLGRYSNNPNYNDKGRGSYSSQEGFISLGWKRKEFKIHGIPEYVNKGIEYISHIKGHCEIPPRTITRMRMKSRSYYVFRFDNEDSRKPLGIIVFEKLGSEAIDENLINDREEILDIITSLLKGMKNIK